MKKSLLLVPLLLSLAACRHVNTVPSTQQIQRSAPEGTLVRVTLRDRDNPTRLTVYTVDVSRDEIVAQSNQRPPPTRRPLEAPGTEATSESSTSSMQQAPPNDPAKLVGDVELYVDCFPKDEKEGCINVADLNDGDPGGSSGGGGDPTGHRRLSDRVKRLAGLTYWSTTEAGIPTTRAKLQQAPAPTPGAK
ncbi:hypothetical protein MYSTI_06079 [Myxococcus stipitatus DSM 14675]|uniref:Lipoprotein n=1 Tax=Myxococcus stipitatus (strain DSM 14675 / JCM 12634 / Mx s8) TaxID=1278073 RepID=L7UIH7_MYXSD|nr:hypothetical protein [Myxococcus stipitatus]AGC47352.1 hypothetical protein MYSTI_06079 [Myxococcus stipitatus DSM 14675]